MHLFLLLLTVFKCLFRRVCGVVLQKKKIRKCLKNISARQEIEIEADGATWNTQTNCNNGNNNASLLIEAMRRDVGTPLQDKKNYCIIAHS